MAIWFNLIFLLYFLLTLRPAGNVTKNRNKMRSRRRRSRKHGDNQSNGCFFAPSALSFFLSVHRLLLLLLSFASSLRCLVCVYLCVALAHLTFCRCLFFVVDKNETRTKKNNNKNSKKNTDHKLMPPRMQQNGAQEKKTTQQTAAAAFAAVAVAARPLITLEIRKRSLATMEKRN